MNNEPEIREPIDMMRSRAYLDFITSAEYKLFRRLQCYVIRGRRDNDPLDLYQDYYRQGKLAAQWRVKDLADWFGLSTRQIRYMRKALEKRGFIKKRIVYKYNKTWNVYELGEVEFYLNDRGDEKTNEKMYYIMELTKLHAMEKLEKMRQAEVRVPLPGGSETSYKEL